MAEKKPESLSEQLAALSYFGKNRNKKNAMRWEELTEAEREPYIDEARVFIMNVGKINMSIVPRVDLRETEQSETKEIEDLTEFIKAFVESLGSVKKELFPCAELATRIVRR